MTRSKLAIIGALTAAALAASAVYASKNSSHDVIDDATLAKANVALDQAITTAEQHTQGKAVQAELEDENGKLLRSRGDERRDRHGGQGRRHDRRCLEREGRRGR